MYKVSAGIAFAFGGFLGTIAFENALSNNVGNQTSAPFIGAVAAFSIFYGMYSLLRGFEYGKKLEALMEQKRS